MATKQEIAKLYVATFNRAADADGLAYWDGTGAVTTDLTDIEDIAQAMLASDEASAIYAGLNREDTVIKMYDNLFNRTVDASDSGVIYWVSGGGSTVALESMILALINGALGADAATISNKTTVGQAFAAAGFNNVAQAISIMQDVTSDYSTVTDALNAIDVASGSGNTFYLTTGQDIKMGTAGDDTFIARGNSSLDNADIIDGGDGIDTIEVMLDNQETAESPLVTNVEVLKVQAQATTVDSGDNDVDTDVQGNSDGESNIDAGDMESVEVYWSDDSRADLVIEDISRNSHITSVIMSETDPDVNYDVYFDPENITAPGSTQEGSTLELRLANVLEIAKAGNPLEGFTGLNFQVDGTAVEVDLTGLTTYAEVDTAIENALDALGLSSKVSVITLPDENVYFSTTINDGGNVYPANSLAGTFKPIQIVATGNAVLTEGGIFDVSNGSDGNLVKTMQDVEPTQIEALTTLGTIIFDRVGKGSQGGDFVAGSDSTGESGSKGIQQFEIHVDRSSHLEEITSTNNTLEVVNVYNLTDEVAAASYTTVHNTAGNGALKVDLIENIRVFDASEMAGDVTVKVTLDETVSAKYLDLTDIAAPSADNSEQSWYNVVDREFSYDFGSGDDTFSLTLDNSNLAVAGTSEREDFVLEINGNAGNDTITTIIGDGSGVDGTNWYENSSDNAALTVNGGAGNDTINSTGAGDWKLNGDAGNDTIYADNSGSQSIGATAGNTETFTLTFTENGTGAAAGETVVFDGVTTTLFDTDASGTVELDEVAAQVFADQSDAAGTWTATGLTTTTETTVTFASNATANVIDATAAAVKGTAITDDGNDLDVSVGTYTQGVTPATATSTNHKGTWVFNASDINIDDLDGNALNTYFLPKATVTVTYSAALDGVAAGTAAALTNGWESQAIQITTGYTATQADINNAIKNAINNDPVLSKLIKAEDGPGNTLVVTSLVDGTFAADDLQVDITAANYVNGSTTDAFTTTEESALIAAYQDFLNDSTAVLADTGAAGTGLDDIVTTLLGAETSYDVEVLAQKNGVDLTGADSTATSDNTINGGTDDDVIVLGTGAESNDTVVFTGSSIGNDTIVNFIAGNSADADKLDFSAYLTSTTSNSGSAESQDPAITKIVAVDATAGGPFTADANDIVIINNFTAVGTETWASMTGSDLVNSLAADASTTNDYGNLNDSDLNIDNVQDGDLYGTTQKLIILIENEANDGEYKVFDVTASTTDITSATLLGTVDFGNSIDAITVADNIA